MNATTSHFRRWRVLFSVYILLMLYTQEKNYVVSLLFTINMWNNNTIFKDLILWLWIQRCVFSFLWAVLTGDWTLGSTWQTSIWWRRALLMVSPIVLASICILWIHWTQSNLSEFIRRCKSCNWNHFNFTQLSRFWGNDFQFWESMI